MLYFTLRKENDSLIITLSNGKKRELDFRLDILSVVRESHDLSDCCDIILHLQQSKPKLISDGLLFEIARFINLNINSHKINWVNTFVAVALIKYDNALDKDKDENNEGISVFDNIDQNLDNLAEINNPETKNALIEQVKHKLKIERIIS